MIEPPLYISKAAFAFLGLALAAPLFASTAHAEDIDTNPEADAFQLRVEQTAAAYDEALATAQKAENDLAENQERIAVLEEQIPKQQKRSDAAARELYKMQQERLNLLDLLLGSADFFDFLNTLDYANRITETNVIEIVRLHDMKSELQNEQSALEQAKSEADASALEAERALTAAQEARLEAQRQAQEAARQAAEAAEAAKVATGTSAPAQTIEGGETSVAAAEAVATINDGADWSTDEAAFVNSWADRIDAYLAGSPLAGQGRTFAQAAWNYGVDPRWSPAIAYTESSLGAACFMPHNAWGWGSASWGSWEEAIDAHVGGLARGYGYTISMDAAYKYCPPSAEHWYSTTLGQMNMI